MSKTAYDVGLDLLSYIGIKSYQPVTGATALNRQSITDDDKSKVLTAINGGLEEVYKNLPADFKKQDKSAQLLPPAQVTVSATQFDTAAVITGAATWMLGCTIQIAGDVGQNRIVALSGSNATLLYGFKGTTGAGISATVYADAILLPSNTLSVGEPVQTHNPNRLLKKAQSKQAFDRYQFLERDIYAPFTIANKAAGFPIYYFVDSQYDAAQERVMIYLRLNPMPSHALDIDYQWELNKEMIAMTDLFTPNTYANPNYKFSSVPATWMDTVFLPICRKRFCAHPSFKNEAARSEINSQYAQAVASLKGQQQAISHGPCRATYI